MHGGGWSPAAICGNLLCNVPVVGFCPVSVLLFIPIFAFPLLISQINYLHLNPYLWICFSGNLNLRQACDDHIGPNPGDCCSSPLPHSRKFWGPLSSLWQPSIKIMGQGGKNWDNPSSSTPVALSGPLGTFGECDSEVDVLHWSRYNCFLLYQMGTFSTFLELLHMEIE